MAETPFGREVEREVLTGRVVEEVSRRLAIPAIRRQFQLPIQFEQWDPLDMIGSLQLAISLDDCWQIGTRNPSDNNCDWGQLFSRSASAVRMA